jgi:hypothetical protein
MDKDANGVLDLAICLILSDSLEVLIGCRNRDPFDAFVLADKIRIPGLTPRACRVGRPCPMGSRYDILRYDTYKADFSLGR